MPLLKVIRNNGVNGLTPILRLLTITISGFCAASAFCADSDVPMPAYTPATPAFYDPAASPVITNAEAKTDAWTLSLRPYLWAASLKGTITAKGVPAKADISFGDILSNLDYAIIGQAELRKGRFFILPDTLLLKVSDTVKVDKSKSGPLGLFKIKGDLDASAEVLTYFQELVAGYRVYERRLSADPNSRRTVSFDVLGGARYYSISTDISASGKIELDGPGDIKRTRKRSGSISDTESWIDPIIGARLNYSVTEQFSLSARGDVGGFGVGSDLSWSASALGQYDFNDRWSMFGGYKVLSIDYKTGDGGLDAKMAGPIIGAQYKITF